MSNNKPAQPEYWFDKSQTLRQSIILYKQINGVASPIMYFTKPKWISNEEFLDTFKRMQIYIAENEQQ